MKRRHVKWIALVAATALGAFLLTPTCQFVVRGFVRGEAFFQGRPTCYWTSALRREETFWGPIGPGGDVGKRLRDGGAAAAPVLAEMLHDEDVNLRFQVLLALHLMRTEARPAVPALAQSLHTETGPRFQLAVQALEAADRDAAIEPLADVLRHGSDEDTRVAAAQELGRHRWRTAQVADALTDALSDPSLSVRVNAARSLSRVRGPSSPVLAILREGLGGESTLLSALAGQTLSGIGSEALPTLVDAVHDPDAGTRQQAIQAIGDLGVMGRPAATHLVTGLEDPAPAVRQAAMEALARVEPVDADLAAVFARRLADGEPTVRRAAVRHLEMLGPEAAPAVPALGRALRDDDSRVRLLAAGVLALLGPAALEAAPALTTALDDVPEVRSRAAIALADIVPPESADARRVVSILQLALREPKPSFVDGHNFPRHAYEALRRLQPDAVGGLSVPDDADAMPPGPPAPPLAAGTERDAQPPPVGDVADGNSGRGRSSSADALIRWSVRAALVLAAVTLALLLPPTTDARQRVARLAWSGGCLMFLAHVAAAFHFIHGWSHAAAHAATARDTAALFGIDWGGGIYFNYVFALAWIGDVAWWWLAPRSHAVRPHWVGALWIGFFLFMAFNGAVLFAAGPARWISTLVFAGLAAAALWNLGTDRGRPGLRES